MSDMSPEPITLTMNSDNTFTHPDDHGNLTLTEWAELNGVSERSVKRWLKDGELPGAFQEKDGKRRWLIPETAVRTRKDPDESESQEVAVADTATDIATTEPDADVDEEFEAHLWRHDLEAYLARMPAYIPVRTGALMLGLGIGHVKGNPERYGILHRGGPNQTDVMPKAIILELAGLARG